jgi:DNA-binding beta-propeller fold protein YncE
MNTAKNIGITTVLIPLTLYAAACSGDTNAQFVHAEKVSKSTFKGTWPVIPDSGVLACDTSKDDAITFTPTGTNTTYAVNATAGTRAEQEGWQRDLQHIWLTADGGQNDTPGVPRVPSSDFMNEGLKVCGNRSSPASPAPRSALPSFQPSQTVASPHTTQVELPFTGLNGPDDVAVDSAGNVYIADNDNRVVKLPVGSNTPTKLPFTGLNRPQGVAGDSAGNVYVTDAGNKRVLKLPARSNTQVELPFTGLQGPTGLAVDSAGNVYVADAGNNRVLKLPVESNTQVGLAFAGLNRPTGARADSAGNVYVTDWGENRVLKLPAGSNTPVKLPFTGLHGPEGVAVDSAGNVYVADGGNNRVLKLGPG